MRIIAVPSMLAEKAQRKVTASQANDRTVFARTPFGRTRIRSFPMTIAIGLLVLAALPFTCISSWLTRRGQS